MVSLVCSFFSHRLHLTRMTLGVRVAWHSLLVRNNKTIPLMVHRVTAFQDHVSPACSLPVPRLWCHTCNRVFVLRGRIVPDGEISSRAIWMFMCSIGGTLPIGTFHIYEIHRGLRSCVYIYHIKKQNQLLKKYLIICSFVHIFYSPPSLYNRS